MNIPFLQGNWIDLVVILILFFFASRAVKYGFWILLADFVSFTISIAASLRLYKFASAFLRANFSLSHSVANAIGFLFAVIVIEAILGQLLTYLVTRLPKALHKNIFNKILGVIPAVGEGLVVVAFILTLALAFPISPKVKKDITESRVGGLIVEKTSGFETKINEIFGGVIEESLTYLTVRPGSRETVELTVGQLELTVDEASEAQIFALVNRERKEGGINELEWRPELVPVAREHGRDMWERSYFGHISPEGEDLGGRLDKAGIAFLAAGENLALAPTVSTAHTGLMNSPGHRENILSTDFNRVGIGIIDNGVYGKIFVQIFTD